MRSRSREFTTGAVKAAVVTVFLLIVIVGASVTTKVALWLMDFAPGPSTIVIRTGDKPRFTVSIVAKCPKCDHEWLIDADSSN